MLSWLAPVDDVLNVFVAPIDALADAVPVTQDSGRGVRIYGWTYTGEGSPADLFETAR